MASRVYVNLLVKVPVISEAKGSCNLYKPDSSTSAQYHKILDDRFDKGERHDCTVRALALVTGEGYEMAHYACECRGRLRGFGMHWSIYEKVLDDLGYHAHEHETPPAKTPITLERLNLRGRYLVKYRSHAGCLIDGKVIGGRKGRRHQVWWITRVTKA